MRIHGTYPVVVTEAEAVNRPGRSRSSRASTASNASLALAGAARESSAAARGRGARLRPRRLIARKYTGDLRTISKFEVRSLKFSSGCVFS